MIILSEIHTRQFRDEDRQDNAPHFNKNTNN